MKIKTFYLYGILVIGLVQVSCVTTRHDEPSDSRGMTSLDVSVEYLSEDRGVLSRKYFPQGVVLAFPYIPGEIFGTPRSRPLFQKNINHNDHFTLNLADALPRMEEEARPLLQTWQETGLAIEPANTRLVRIGTFPFDAKTREPIGGGGFIEENSKDNLILMYFDRACHIQGGFEINEEIFSHDIKVPGRGFHFIRVRPTARNQFHLEYFPGQPSVTFSIHVFNLQRV
mgnify:FL=1